MEEVEFYETLRQIVSELSADDLLAIPGIYDVLAEELEEEVLDRINIQKL